jgi:predicted lipoprotein with Yx(FWY)xxD motif
MTTRIARWAAPASVALALVIAGCGGSNSGSGSGETSAAAPGTTISAKQLAGLGAVLVDDQGHALYASDQEASGKIRCTGGCLTFWDPLTTGASAPTGGSDVTGKLATIRRSDGKRQVTYKGMPLYRFTEDPGPGKVTGNDFKDAFGGTSFTWHAVTTAGLAGASSQSNDTQQRNDYGY